MNTDGEMLPIPPVKIDKAQLREPVYLTAEDSDILIRLGSRNWPAYSGYARQRAKDDLIMLTRTMCPEAKPAVKDLAVFLKFSQ
jgi:hypothetical protein